MPEISDHELSAVQDLKVSESFAKLQLVKIERVMELASDLLILDLPAEQEAAIAGLVGESLHWAARTIRERRIDHLDTITDQLTSKLSEVR